MPVIMVFPKRGNTSSWIQLLVRKETDYLNHRKCSLLFERAVKTLDDKINNNILFVSLRC